MLGPIGSEIMAIFRLLSPDEIDKYIVDEKSRKVGESMPMAANGEPMQFNDEEAHLENKQNRKFPKDHKAKIIPINDKVKKDHSQHKINSAEEEIIDEQASNKSLSRVKDRPQRSTTGGNDDLESMGILSASSIREIEEERLRKENSKKDSATVFLLKEREKMRSSKKRLIEQQAIRSYQINAAQEFYESTDDELLDEDGNSSGDLKGILLNKKHF